MGAQHLVQRNETLRSGVPICAQSLQATFRRREPEREQEGRAATQQAFGGRVFLFHRDANDCAKLMDSLAAPDMRQFVGSASSHPPHHPRMTRLP